LAPVPHTVPDAFLLSVRTFRHMLTTSLQAVVASPVDCELAERP
jgi:hypothetical protein